MSTAEKNLHSVAVVTGAGTGIGRAVSLALLKAGYSVALAGRRSEPLEAVVAEARALGFDRAMAVSTDVSKPDSVTALF
jgi:NADP-dependent 3-hydroxy acid dehydrogenase YdfG